MSGWYRVTLSVDDMASGKGLVLQDQFEGLYRAAGSPKGATIAKATDVMANEFYFSPGATQFAMPLIRAYAGVECSAPRRDSVRPAMLSGSLDDIPFA